MSKRVAFMLAVAALMLMTTKSATLFAQNRVQEEFHQTYQLAPDGRVQLENINGSVRITGWDRNEVKVDAVKWAYTKERLNEAQIVVEPNPDNIRIYTKYPERDEMNFNNNSERRVGNPATVEYTLFVPRNARLDSIELINGGLQIEGVSGDVRASSINGALTARGLRGEAKLSTINGNLDATFNQLDASKSISLSSVSGSVTITIPSDASANLRANTVSGGINNDFGLPVRRGEYVGNDLAGQLGQGATRIRLANVSGAINIRRAQDGRAQSQVTNLLNIREKEKNKPYKVEKEDIKEAMREAREAQLEVMQSQRANVRRAQADAARAARDAQREAERAGREANRASASVSRSISSNSMRLIERDSKSFAVTGTPLVRVETFDGAINVRAWDKREVSYNATKRAADQENMQGIRIIAEQRGGEVVIRAEFDASAANRLGDVQATTAFEVFVPQQANLRLSTGDGRLSIEGVTGEMKAATGDGAVDVRDARGSLTVNTGDGRIRITNFDGAAQATTGDGGITLDGRFTRLAASTSDGAIALALPADASATIETNADSVLNEGLATSEDNDETKRVRRWKVGAGGNLMTLKTGGGRIYLRRSGQQ